MNKKHIPIIFLSLWSVYLAKASIIVPNQAHMVNESDIIIEGSINYDGNNLNIKVKNWIKGDQSKKSLLKIVPLNQIYCNDLLRKVEEFEEKQCIILGQKKGDSSIILPWSYFSIWPLGYNNAGYTNTFEDNKKFILKNLYYQKLSAQGDEVVLPILIKDLKDSNLHYCVLGFIDAYSNNCLSYESSKDFLTYSLICLYLSNKDFSSKYLKNTLSMSSRLPPSLLLEYYKSMHEYVDENQSARMLTQAKTIFKTRKMLNKKEQVRNISELLNTKATNLNYLTVLDANKALLFFDSPVSVVRKSPPEILQKILSATPSTSQDLKAQKQDKSFWKKEIEKLNTH